MLRHHQHPAATQGLSPPRCPVTRARQAQERLRACRCAPALPAVGRLKHEQIKRRQDCARVRVPLTRRRPTPTRPFPLLPSPSLCRPSLCCPSLPFAARPFPVSHSTSTLHVDVVPAATVCPVGSGRVFWMIPSHSTIRSLCTHRIDANTSKASAGKTARVSLRASLTRRWPTQTRAASPSTGGSAACAASPSTGGSAACAVYLNELNTRVAAVYTVYLNELNTRVAAVYLNELNTRVSVSK